MIIPIYTINGLSSPEDQIEAVRNKTDEGYRYMLAENGLLKYLLEKL